jgi:hypothetical protein
MDDPYRFHQYNHYSREYKKIDERHKRIELASFLKSKWIYRTREESLTENFCRYVINPLKQSGYYVYHLLSHLNFCALSTECIYVFYFILTENSDCYLEEF